jgi:hypothetical protein
MKIVRLLSLACVLALLAACGTESITGPDAERRPAASTAEGGSGQFGSGN